MNAKKTLTTILVAGFATVALAACGGTSSSSSKKEDSSSASAENSSSLAGMTRNEAMVHLKAISTAVSAESFVAPTGATIVTTNGGNAVSTIKVAANYIHADYASDITTTVSSVVSTVATAPKIYAYVDGVNTVVYYKNGTTEYVFNENNATVLAALTTKTTLELNVSRNNVSKYGTSTWADYIGKYLADFNTIDGVTDGVYTGATDLSKKAKMKAESYDSTATGNLTCDITPRYYDTYDERMIYAWDNNLLVTVQNDHSGTKTTYDWSAIESTKPTLPSAPTALDEAGALAAIALIA